MAPKKLKITEDTNLEALLKEPGWKPVSSDRLKKIKEQIQEAVKQPAIVRRGGARPGAGRKPLPEDKRRVAISAMVAPKTFRWLNRLAGSKKNKKSIGAVLDGLAAK